MAANKTTFKKGHERVGGRKPGSVNKSTAEIKALAQEHGADAIKVLASVMNNKSESGQTRIAAAKELLERGYGKVTQSFSGPDGGSIPVAHHADADTLALLRQIAGIGPDSELPPANP